MESAHTPGPWRVEADTALIWGDCNPGASALRSMGYPIAECKTSRVSKWAEGPNEDEWQSNALLIAAAPDMLAALEMALNDMEYVQRAHPEITGLAHRGKSILAVRAAIAKAKGAGNE